ncbi:helix-turn-helix transcriptional regulator [Bacillus thuringiensis]|nr:helix-turn-helix transcriptional regulator [Bacillus thuringiensis]MED2810002.1 helix-turn-helix transcriptional regulator [Bacillus thuringiensis]MED2827144.1 helix-turn-helix transcriptional regulator [Bacillus thuringiensis]MED2832862.1 helix-turn-helix transcriptional regulator [Bacillus thuringiensis]MED2851142.1 helix-turn-helix transcriptional regulator [Bacillus thuringiensis]
MYEIKKVDLNRIKNLRKKHKITLEEMSIILGYKSPNGYHYIEKGRIKFSAEALAQVANILKVPIDSLFFEE